METFVLVLCVIGFMIPLIILVKANEYLRQRNRELYSELSSAREETHHYKRLYYTQGARTYSSPASPREIPKGTIQAVKEAMKRSHPDNGGNAEEFQMYRRAYNVLTGKEKL